jgi:hypothetical protein
MPKSTWEFFVTVIGIAWMIVTQFWGYEDIVPAKGMSKNEWRWGMFGVFVLISIALYLYMRNAGRGRVSANMLEMENGAPIPLANVEKIVSEGWGFPAVVFAAGDQINMHIPRSDLVKLAKTRLNQWTVGDREIITLTPAEPGQELQISYSARGAYEIYKSARLAIWFIALLSCPLLSDAFGFTSWLIAFFAYTAVLVILPHFDPVEASVAGDTVSWKLYGKEETFRLSDVASLQRRLFHISVTTENGDVFRFPRAFVLLPELIEELAAPLAGRN